jgi:hypothetical protein
MAFPTPLAAGAPPCQARLRSISRSCRRIAWSCASSGSGNARPRTPTTNGPAWSCCSPITPPAPALPQPAPWRCTPTPSGAGASPGAAALPPWTTSPAAAARPLVPPAEQAVVKAIAGEAVYPTDWPLRRLSVADLAARARQALGKPLSPSTTGRILDGDTSKPWRYAYGLCPRDPQFADPAGRALDRYAGWWAGQRLGPRDYVRSAAAKTSSQARGRCHPTSLPGPGRSRRVEHEYERGGALHYLAAGDVRRGRALGRCAAKTGSEPLGRLVDQVMTVAP